MSESINKIELERNGKLETFILGMDPKYLTDDEKVIATFFNVIKKSVGLDISMKYNPVNDLIKDSKSLAEALEKICNKITSLEEQINN